MQEDVYEGYRIPEGATVIANIFAITRDEEMYPDPSEFRPERFLGPSPQLDPHKFVFGFGRRACPGACHSHHVILTEIQFDFEWLAFLFFI
jgi:cytochrome P450